MKVYRNPPINNVIILVVTVPGCQVEPTNIHFVFSTSDFKVILGQFSLGISTKTSSTQSTLIPMSVCPRASRHYMFHPRPLLIKGLGQGHELAQVGP